MIVYKSLKEVRLEQYKTCKNVKLVHFTLTSHLWNIFYHNYPLKSKLVNMTEFKRRDKLKESLTCIIDRLIREAQNELNFSLYTWRRN